MSEHNRADVAIWRLVDNTPQRYRPASLKYEKYLEDWIERDPSLVSPDLHLVGRQIKLDTGYLDILGIDTLGRWAAIELKKTGVRRHTVAQALDYAGCLAEMSPAKLKALVKQCLAQRGIEVHGFMRRLDLDDWIFEASEILIYVVGTSRDINLDRLLKHTSFQGNPIRVVTFDIYKNSDGEQVLLRQLSEADIVPISQPPTSAAKIPTQLQLPLVKDDRLERLFQIAENNGIGNEFRKVYDLAMQLGLYPKIFKWSIMYAPQQNKNRVLICTWVNSRSGRLDVYFNTDAFAEFYPISQQRAQVIAGEAQRSYLTPQQTDQLIATTRKLFDEILRNS